MTEQGENRASVKPTLDQPRLLGRSLGYTHSPIVALHHEGEAVSEADQQWITEQVAQRVQDDRREALRAQVERVTRTQRHHEQLARHAARELARLQRKIAG